MLVSLGLAVFWGAAHALSPGHGKTIVSAYLVGSRGTPWHAALLGLITTATHTAGVFALGRDHPAALAVDRPRHPLPVARPGRRADGRRGRLRRADQSAPGMRAPTGTATIITITTTGPR